MDLSQIPALDPPEGVVPNFIDPPKDNTGAYAVLAICLVLSTAAILSRVYSRVFVVRQIFLADCEQDHLLNSHQSTTTELRLTILASSILCRPALSRLCKYSPWFSFRSRLRTLN
ncbi:hypothetical protein V8F06_001683 [Rhypophila decipiens]